MPYHPDCPYCNGAAEHRGKGCPLRKRSGRVQRREITALDCETIGGRIVLFLACGSNGRAEYLHDPQGLTMDRILDWMLLFSARLCIGYFFDYDVQMILRQLPPQFLHQLRLKGRCLYRKYRIRHIPQKRFSVTDTETGDTVTIWNVSGWTQCSFVKLITDWGIGTPEEQAFVASMKAKRSDLSNETSEDLVRYTTLECRLLSVWFERMLALHESVGIRLTAYSGAGSTAAAMFRKAKWEPPEVPPHVQTIAEAAFFGGRSETSCIGEYEGDVFGYDINSAYPFAIANLPDIRGAKWYRTKRYDPHLFGFWRVRWKQPAKSCWGLFPVRGAKLPTGKRSLSLLYPIEGEGWFHSCEVAIAVKTGYCEPIEGLVIEPKGKPFDWVLETVEERLRLKSEGNPANIVLKLGLNSLYGKLAQHSGQHPLQCMVYAAAITARTRAMILDAIHDAGHQVLLVATDGILSTRPLDLPLSGRLGEWEFTLYRGAWILQAGVYWAGGKIRTRGIDGRSLDRAEVDRLWRKRGVEAKLTLPVRRVVSYRAACARGKPELAGEWIEQVRTVRFDPRPRRKRWKWDGGRLLTLPADVQAYLAAAALDQASLDALEEAAYDDCEALPDWMF